MKAVYGSILLPLGKVQLAGFKSRRIPRISKNVLHLRQSKTSKLSQEFPSSFADHARQFRLMIAEEKKRRRRPVLLPLKKHRSARSQKQQCCHRFVFARCCE